jgi:hypothetical protein
LLEADNDTAAAALVIAATDPDYTATFLRAVRSEHGYRAWTADEQRAYVRVEAACATMSEGGSGSYLVPFVLDPSVVLTNSSITNPGAVAGQGGHDIERDMERRQGPTASRRCVVGLTLPYAPTSRRQLSWFMTSDAMSSRWSRSCRSST